MSRAEAEPGHVQKDGYLLLGEGRACVCLYSCSRAGISLVICLGRGDLYVSLSVGLSGSSLPKCIPCVLCVTVNNPCIHCIVIELLFSPLTPVTLAGVRPVC